MRIVTSLIATLGLLAACGGPTVVPVSGKVGSVPSAHWRTVLTYEFDFDGARKAGRIPAGQTNEAALAEAVEVFRNRVFEGPTGDFGVEARAPNQVQVGFAHLSAAEQTTIRRLLERAGSVEFAVEVLPDVTYQRLAGNDEPAPARSGVWPDSEEVFDAFKRAEWKRWKTAREKGELYRPSNPRFRLVKHQERDGSHLAHFHVVEHRPLEQRVDGKIIKSAHVSQTMNGMPVATLEIARNYQDLFRQFTEANLGMPLAILIDDEFAAAPRVMAPISQNVQIGMGSQDRTEALQQAQDLVLMMQSGDLVVTPQFVGVETR